jgi:hypothetical protein
MLKVAAGLVFIITSFYHSFLTGQFTASVEGSDGDIGADVLAVGTFEYAVKFVPRKEGWSFRDSQEFPLCYLLIK